jgi:TfuA protein
MKTIVFYGPSISAAELGHLMPATHAPPIRRGDLDTVGHHNVIVILDGEFGQSLSVSPKEILAVIEQGKTVIGASSMGALRASELDRHGMIGIGWVYEYFRRSEVRRDADVALVYAPFDFKPMTVPMVDVEYWMEQALAAERIADTERNAALKAARKIFFAERTAERLMEVLRQTIGAAALQSLIEHSGGTIPSIKSADAIDAVRFAASLAQPHQHAKEA